MTDLPLGTLQASLVEVDLIDGERCEDEPSFDVDAVEAHYAAKGRLLLAPGVEARLSEIADSFDTYGWHKGEPRLHRAALAPWERAREAS